MIGPEPTDIFRTIIRNHARTYELTSSGDTSGGPLGEPTGGGSTKTVDLWMSPPNTVLSDQPAGEREQADETAVALSADEIALGDRLSYGGREYRVDTIDVVPDAELSAQPNFCILGLTLAQHP